MTFLLAGVVAAGAGFVGRADGTLKLAEDWSFFRVGYTHYLEPVDYLDAPVPTLALFEGSAEIAGAVETGSEGYLSLEIGGRYSWGELAAGGALQTGDLDRLSLDGYWFITDDLAATLSFDFYGAEGDALARFVRFGAKLLLDIDEYTLFIEAELGPVFEPDSRYDFDLTCAARFFLTTEIGVGFRFSTYGDDYFFPGAEYFAVTGEYYMRNGLGFNAAVGGVAESAFLGLGADYRF